MFAFYNLYDFLATIVPGAYLGLVALAMSGAFSEGSKIIESIFGKETAIQAFGLLALAFIAGHVLHPVGNALEYFLRRKMYGGKSAGQAVLNSGSSLSQPFREELRSVIEARFKIPPSCDDAYYLCYTDVLLHARDSLATRLRALRGFYRELSVAGLTSVLVVGFVSVFGSVDRSKLLLWGVLAAIVSTVALVRYLRFSNLVAAVTLRTFFVRERKSKNKPVSDNARKGRGDKSARE